MENKYYISEGDFYTWLQENREEFDILDAQSQFFARQLSADALVAL